MDTLEKKTSNPQPASAAPAILARIATEQLTPTPRYAFVVREWAVWGSWLLSIFVGALAIAVAGYVGMSAEYALYEATHDNFWTFAVTVLPYLWLIVLLLMTTVATIGLRQTKRGYRYTTWFIIVSSLLLSLLGGMVAHSFGLGYHLDTQLGQQLSLYMSLEKKELAMWQAPESGRLIGMLVPETQWQQTASGTPNSLPFQDIDGNLWQVSGSELSAREMALLNTRSRVRLLGTTTSATQFHICGVFPWMYERAMPWSDMQQERQLFENRMKRHRGHREEIDSVGLPGEPIDIDTLCAHLEMMDRLR